MYKTNSLKIIGFFAAFIVLLSLMSSVSASDWSSIIRKIKDKYESQNTKIKDITTIRDMKMTPEGKEMIMESTAYKKGDKFRIETAIHMPEMPAGMPSMKTIIIYDGKDTWSISPTGGKKKLSDENDKQYKMEGKWWKWLESGKIIGEQKYNGRTCYVVQFEKKDDIPFSKGWFDKEKLYAMKFEFKKTEKGDSLAEIAFSDYRTVIKDIEMPYKTEFSINGKNKFAYDVKSIKVNTGLSDDLFDPDKVEGGSMQEMMKKMMQQKGGNY
ncbi:MAG: hypothetical protein B5M53_00805 [Candidatus Cloacimonas sp. 4484_209]|nr:MAG: hypothetical protein B5M53_00805 [Candidatus Cloacimonas sp. 4484_209]